MKGLPWNDIQDYGTKPKQYAYTQHSTTAILVAGSPVVSLVSSPFSQQLTNGQGVCIWKAGAPTTQTTPTAPTISSPAMSGTQTFLYACVGYDAYGGLTASSPIGQITTSPALGANVQQIIAISRAADGTLTITTKNPHNYLLQYGQRNPTVIAIQDCSPLNLNGMFTISAVPSPNTIICKTPVLVPQAGVVSANSSTTVWAFNLVKCPTVSGSTLGYYVYSNSPSPGGALTLIGKTLPGESHFTDWGQTIMAGYQAPGYVPVNPPSENQNQMFFGRTVVSGAGTASITLSGPALVSGSFPILYDDGPNLLATAQAAAAQNSMAGLVLLSPSEFPFNFPGYIFNSPITLPGEINFEFACRCFINETITFPRYNQITAGLAATGTKQTAQFGQRSYVDISGIANPIFSVGAAQGNNSGISIDGLGFTCESNGQVAVMNRGCFFSRVSNCSFSGYKNTFGNAVGLVYMGSCSLATLADCNFEFSFGPGPDWGPPIPAVWIRGSDNPNIPNGQVCTGNFLMKGMHTFGRRGILFDHLYDSQNGNSDGIYIGDAIWCQANTTPTVMFWGELFVGVELHNILNDTSQEAVIANWTNYNVFDVSIRNCYNSLQPLVTGKPMVNVTISGSSNW